MGTLIPFNSAQTNGTLAGGLLRPVNADGVLIAASEGTRNRRVLWTLAGEELTQHLERVCMWRADLRDTAWQPGDYSFYTLEFQNGAGAALFVQFWSEPDERTVGFQVCSGARNEAAARHLNRKRQEELRDRGFETGGGAGNFAKQVCVDAPGAVRALAREALGVLCKVLGYDGTVDLRYHLHLGTRLESRQVHTGINLEDLAKLLRGWSCRVDPYINNETGQPIPNLLTCEYYGHRFTVSLARGLSTKEGQYGLVCFRRYVGDKSLPLAQLANRITSHLFSMQACVDDEGELQLGQVAVVDGGICADNLRSYLWLWHSNLQWVLKLIQGGDAAAG